MDAPVDTNSGVTQENFTRDAAAAAVVEMDTRPFEVTEYDQLRRKFEPSSSTEAHARRAIDASEAFAGLVDDTDERKSLARWTQEISPERYRALRQQAHEMADA